MASLDLEVDVMYNSAKVLYSHSVVWGWLVLVTLSANAQAPTLRFEQLGRDQGLSESTVNAIVEDQRGFMWFGTNDGLNRYDGYTFVTYRSDANDPQSLSHNEVLSLLEDRAGTLWVATDYGLNRFDRGTDSFVRYFHDNNDATSISHNLITALLEDQNGVLWVGTFWGLNRYDPTSDSFIRYPYAENDGEEGLSNPIVRSLLQDSEGYIWIGTEDGGLNRLDPNTDSFKAYRNDPEAPNSLNHDEVRSLFEDRSGTLWVGTHGGLDRFDRKAESFDHFVFDIQDPQSIGSNYVDTIFEDSKGDLWVGTDGGGLNWLDRESDTFIRYQHIPNDETSIGSNVVRVIYEDSKSDLWVGTYIGGANFYNRNNTAFSYYHHNPDDENSLSHSAVLSFFEEEDGTLWVGTEGGLNRFDRETQTIRRFQHNPTNPTGLSANAVLSIYKDSRGLLWAGTYFGGLNLFDEATETFSHYRPDGANPNNLSNPHVWDIIEDPEGYLWLATFGGLNRFDYATQTFKRYRHNPNDETSIGHSIVWNLYVDRQGQLWAATDGGLSVYDRAQDTFKTYRHDEQDSTSLSSIQALSIMEDRQGRYWIGTLGGGLNLYNLETGAFTSYGMEDGFASDVVYGILEDEQGLLWISTNEGLSRFNPETKAVTNYDQSNWLLAAQFDKNAFLKSRTGELFFGGNNGINSFFPNHVKDNPHIPPIVLTDIQIFNKPVPIGGEEAILQKHITEAEQVSLTHEQSVISLSFAALNFRSPEKNQYAYKLEPFEQDWQYVGTKRATTYTNLDPGTYTFRVKGSNDSGVWNEEGTSITIDIAPPIWATWWFRTLGISVGIGLLILFYQVRTRSIRNRNWILQGEITERKRAEAQMEHLMQQREAQNLELEAKNAELEQKNSELERFTYTVSHDLKSPLVTIRGFLGLVQQDALAGNIEQLNKDIDFINGATDKMQQLLNELLELSRVGRIANSPEVVPLEELAREAVELAAGSIAKRGVTVAIAESMPMVSVDRSRMTEVFQNFIDNAIKFFGEQTDPHIEIGAQEKGTEVFCYVQDNGIGIDPKYHHKVFGLFERLDATNEGTGIGLALVKRIVEVHGGRVWVESEGKGKGTTFWFTLPVNGQA